MLKPFADRVKSTYDLMFSLINESSQNATSLLSVRKTAIAAMRKENNFPLKWVPDYSNFNPIRFKGYEKDSAISEATGLNKYFFNHKKPFDKEIKFFCYYKGIDTVVSPVAYVIPQGWESVLERLKSNKVKINRFSKDTVMDVTAYYITSNQSLANPYEKHHKNYNTGLRTEKISLRFRKGDYWIPSDQKAKRYFVETLEPKSEDGFFAWNFFDAILQQIEGYSDYRWEDIAAELLKNQPGLKEKLELKKREDSSFASDSHKILDFIYKNSSYYEKTHLRYPVYRVE